MQNTYLDISKGLIIFISGVPSTGKTTVSYELLKRYDYFRIIEETDIIRDILRGYNKFLTSKSDSLAKDVLKSYEVFDNTKILSYEEASQQCEIMKNSILNIVQRQKRRKISSIINGVHIVPDKLKNLVEDENIIFINLYVDDKTVLKNRLFNREPSTYMLNFIDEIYSCNCKLFEETQKLTKLFPNKFLNINVTCQNIDKTLNEIKRFLGLDI